MVVDLGHPAQIVPLHLLATPVVDAELALGVYRLGLRPANGLGELPAAGVKGGKDAGVFCSGPVSIYGDVCVQRCVGIKGVAVEFLPEPAQEGVILPCGNGQGLHEAAVSGDGVSHGAAAAAGIEGDGDGFRFRLLRNRLRGGFGNGFRYGLRHSLRHGGGNRTFRGGGCFRLRRYVLCPGGKRSCLCRGGGGSGGRRLRGGGFRRKYCRQHRQSEERSQHQAQKLLSGHREFLFSGWFSYSIAPAAGKGKKNRAAQQRRVSVTQVFYA